MHAHAHPPVLWKLQISLLATVAFIVVEIATGVVSGSLSLISDAAHNFADCLALGLAWFAAYLQQKPPDQSKTFGYHRAGVVAALFNAASLIAMALWILFESYERLAAPRDVNERLMIYVAVAGIALNVFVMRALHAHSKGDLNIRSAYVHMLGDALASVGIVIGGALIAWTGWLWVDPALSALIGTLILWTGGRIVSEALNILLEGLPAGMSLEDVRSALLEVDDVLEVHDLHIWSLSADSHAMCCHAVIPDKPPSASQSILDAINETVAERFGIRHATVQFEHRPCKDYATVCSALEHDSVRGDSEASGRCAQTLSGAGTSKPLR